MRHQHYTIISMNISKILNILDKYLIFCKKEFTIINSCLKKT